MAVPIRLPTVRTLIWMRLVLLTALKPNRRRPEPRPRPRLRPLRGDVRLVQGVIPGDLLSPWVNPTIARLCLTYGGLKMLYF
eukprot:5620750-Heterocapsa_arctica.AAC.1